MKIILSSIIFLQFFKLIFSIEQLVVEEFTSKTFTVADATNWSVKQVTRCETTTTSEFESGDVFGLFGKTYSSTVKTVNIPQPHWSVNVRFDMLLYGPQDSSDYITVKVDSQSVDKKSKVAPGKGTSACSKVMDVVVLYDKNITIHNTPTLTLTINSIMKRDDEGFVMKNLFIYVDTCHQSCASCKGPTEDQCLTCPNNSQINGNKCSCITGLQHQFNCVPSCPTGFTPDSTNKICVIDFCAVADCQTCTNKLCTVCVSGKKLLSGQCVSSCPSYAPETSGVCKEILNTLKNGKYLMMGLFSDKFGQSEIYGLGFTTTGFVGGYNESTGALVTKCGNKNLFGGAYLASKGSYIQNTFNNLAPHYQVIVGYTLYSIDEWNSKDFSMSVDGTSYVSTKNNGSSGNICGLMSQNEEITQITKTIPHTVDSMNLKFQTTISGHVFINSFGIREVFVLIDECDSSCQACNGSGNKNCTQCKSGTFLNPDSSCLPTCPVGYGQKTSDLTCQLCHLSCYSCKNPADASSCTACTGNTYLLNNKCVASCVSPYIQVKAPNNNTCQKCDATCLTCDGGNNNNCLSCQGPTYFWQSASKTCVTSCNTKQYKNTSNQQCSDCDSTCTTCSGGLNNNCLTCSGSLFFDNATKKCVGTCPDSFYNNTTGNQCSSCESSCATCDGGAANQCLTCISTKYYQSGTKQCVPACESNQYADSARSCKNCDPSCNTCSGGNNNNCLTCSGSSYLDKTTNKCVSPCPNNYYGNTANHECTKCDNSCTTCSGGLNNNCLTCSGSLFFDNATKKCVTNCPDSFYNNTTGNQCSSCESSCATCDGGAANQCLTCISTKYYQSGTKQCVPACESKQYADSARSCKNCDPSCNTCSGGNDNNCLTCTGSLYLDKATNKCVSPCPNSYYGNTANHECTKCDLSCATCSGGLNNNCLTCSGSLFFDNATKKCVGTCPDKFYNNPTGNQCSSCEPSCATCNGGAANQCLTCISTKYYQSGTKQCVAACDSNQYADNTRSCQSCHLSCNTCSGGNDNNCLTCTGSLYLDKATNKCVSPCPNNYYGNETNHECTKCDLSCATCSGGLNNNCLTCSGSLFFDNATKKCVSQCPNGQYGNASNQCTKCENSCATCDGGLKTNCLSCNLPNYYQQSTKQCVQTCNSNQYQDNPSVSCKNCDPSCATCSGGLKNNCKSCSGSLFFDSLSNSCVSKCPDTFYNDVKNQTCSGCNETCATCDGGAANQCLTCNPPRFHDNLTNECVTTCNLNQFFDDTSKSCHNCDLSCKTCSGANANNCLSCNENYYLDKTSNKCVSSCPDNYYPNNLNKQCIQCEGSCKTCDGGSNTNCLSCQLPNYFQQSTKKCVNQCNPGQYNDGPSATCKSCNPACATCNGGSDSDCLSCSGNNYLDPFSAKCISTCPNNYYAEKSNNKCTKCESTCETCDGGSNSNCLSCIFPNFYQQSTKQCVTQCNSNQYQDKPSATCKNCDNTCAKCSGGSKNDCLSCSGSLYFDSLSNSCVSKCPDKFYNNPKNNLCDKCDATCETCDGGDANQCLTCNSSRYHDSITKQCVSSCSPNQYLETASKQCKNCDTSCLTCSGGNSNNCLSCSNSLFLDKTSNKCVTTCPDNYYKNLSQHECTKCDITCATCDGGSNSDCLSCDPSRKYQQPLKQCVTECNTNQYLESNSKLCKSCDNSCATCKGPNNNDCLTCQGSLFHDPQTNKCTSTCPNNYFPNKQNNKCMICDSSCATCDGGLDTNCLSCNGNKYLQQSLKQCVINCSSGQFKDIVSNKCKNCDDSCATCDGTQKNQCLTCQGSLYFDKTTKQCVQTCPDGQFADKSNNKCTGCENTCKTCDNRTNKDCLSCDGNYHYLKETKECVIKCPSPYFEDNANHLCIKCKESCQICSSGDSCTKCIEGYFLEGNSCNSKCKDGFYGDKSTQKCLKCNSTCKTCFGPSEQHCDECADSQLTNLNGTCTYKCPYYIYYMDTYPYKKCIQCHYKCRTGCSGTGEEDCNTIKVQYQIIFYILIFKSGLWIMTFIWGVFKDRKVQKNSTVRPQASLEFENQKIQDNEISQMSPTKLTKIASSNDEDKFNKFGTLNYLERQITMTNLNQTHLNVAEPTTRRRRMRAKFIRDSILPSNYQLEQVSPISQNRKQDLSPIESSSQSFAVIDQRQRQSTINTRNNLITSNIMNNSEQTTQDIKADEKFKYTIIGNEWISLFKLNDPVISRPSRTTLIYLKYQSFFFATQFIYEYTIKYIALCLIVGWSVKFVLTKGLQLTATSSSRMGNIIVNMLFQGLLFCHFFFWFIPQLMNLFFEKDYQWSIFYCIVFSADFIIFQQIFSLFEYLMSVKYINSQNSKNKIQKSFLKLFKSDVMVKYIQKK